MTTQHFGPLPPSDFNRDKDHIWLNQQTISFQKIITGSLQAGQELSSANYVAGSAGWMIDGDGNAEFNDISPLGVFIPPTSWTPTLKALTTNPTLGSDSSVEGQYSVINGWCHAWVRIRFGTSGVATGTGTYSIDPPVTPHASLVASDVNYENSTVGHGGARDNSASGASTVCRVAYYDLSGSPGFGFHSVAGINAWNHSAPWAWAASDRISVQLSYPVDPSWTP